MKQKLSLLALALCLITSAQAVQPISPIPDNDLNGIQSSTALSGFSGSISDVNVTLNIAGGFNGDFYAYLYHNSTMAVLLNRTGRTGTSALGYPDAGFGLDAAQQPFRFDDQATRDVHLYRTFAYTLNATAQLTGTWQPDARKIDPLSAGTLFDSASRSAMLNVFNGMDPNGLWLLYVADVSPGFQGALVNWGLDVTTVPEPASFGFVLLGAGACLWRRR
jgi:subtilisin-like proprotein convertase family protein